MNRKSIIGIVVIVAIIAAVIYFATRKPKDPKFYDESGKPLEKDPNIGSTNSAEQEAQDILDALSGMW